MKAFGRTPLLFGMIVFSVLPRATRAEADSAARKNLEQCYEAALARSETIADQGELVRQQEERYRQAVGGILPNVSGVASYQQQDASGLSSASNIFPASQPLVKLTGTQPIFRGLREFAALKQTKLLREAQEQAKAQAARELYKDVAQNFYAILTLERDLANLATEVELYEKRIAELRGRVKIGRSRLSEVLTVEASAANLMSQAELARGQLSSAREAFAFLTGLPGGTLLRDGADETPVLAPLERYLERLEERPELKASRSRLEAAGEGSLIAKGAHLPSIDLNGNYYFKRSGALKDSKWDASVVLTLPIFAGGATQSRVREAVSIETQSELAVNRARREAEQEVRSLHANLRAEKDQLDALSRARELSEKSYVEQTREYRLGLVNNLEALSALAAFQESGRALDRARLGAKLDFIRLETAASLRPAALRPAPLKKGAE